MTPIDTRIYRFHPPGLDPIVVYVEEYSPGSSRIVVQCYAGAWTAYWGAHGNHSVECFVVDCNNEYVADNLIWGLNGTLKRSYEKTTYAYLCRIVTAIQEHFASLEAVKLKGGVE